MGTRADAFRELNARRDDGIVTEYAIGGAIASLFSAEATRTYDVAYQRKREWHRQPARLPLQEKFRILLELQRQDYPLLKRHRQLRPWEKPWEIDP